MTISRTVFNLQGGDEYLVEMAMFNVQRTITPKVGKPELLYMCSSRCVIVLYIYVKFGEKFSNGIRVMKRTRIKEALTDRRTNRRNDGRTLKILDGITKYSHHFLWRGITM